MVHGTVPFLKVGNEMFFLESNRLNFRKMKYLNIDLPREYAAINIRFNTDTGDCVYCTVSYAPRFSNIKGRQFDVEVLNEPFERRDLIKFVFINISSCNIYSIPTWSVVIYSKQRERGYTNRLFPGINFHFLAQFVFERRHYLSSHIDIMPPSWCMVHMIRPVEIALHTIWRIWIHTCYAVSQVSLEVLLTSIDRHYFITGTVLTMKAIMFTWQLMKQSIYL